MNGAGRFRRATDSTRHSDTPLVSPRFILCDLSNWILKNIAARGRGKTPGQDDSHFRVALQPVSRVRVEEELDVNE